jgi:hypothetical protein
MDHMSKIPTSTPMKETYLVVTPNLTDELAESLVDIDAVLSRGLNKLAIEVFRKVTTLCGASPLGTR